jgi:hypothetical protein
MPTERQKALVSAPFFRGILVFALFALITLLWFRHSRPVEGYEDKRAAVRLEKLQKLRADDELKLNHYAWADSKSGVVQVPLSRAVELELSELKLKTPQATEIKVENPYPAGLQQAPVPMPTKEEKK